MPTSAETIGSSSIPRLEGDGANDQLSGGLGADVFDFDQNGGSDTIDDYAAADQLDVAAFAFANVAAVIATGQQVGADVVFTFDATTSVTISAYQLSAFDDTDFIL